MVMGAKDMSDANLIRCASCGARNRLRQTKAHGLRPICGQCKKPLPVSEAVTVTDATFAADVECSPLPVLLDMWAPWCGPCRTIAPMMVQIAEEMAGRVRVAKLNVDENPVTAARFNVSSIPTLLMLKKGEVIDRIVGVQTQQEIMRRLQQIL
jgi:thioredoxin 2